MRLDARTGDVNWSVFHIPECRPLKFVVWIDDEIAQWADVCQPMRFDILSGDLAVNVHQATKILIIPSRRLVLIDPVDDSENTSEPAQKDLVAS